MRLTIRVISSMTLAAGLAMLGCGGVETAPSKASAPPDTGSTPAALHGHGGHSGDEGDNIEWVCRASPVGGGPIFYGASNPDLSGAMGYAVDECEGQTGEDCTQRGCSFYRH